jgi:beta-lactamase regulating signal transducer with metallopeptidase domain
MTAGIFAPKILLPTAWTLWPDEKLRAVLAHELAHVRRRDPLRAGEEAVADADGAPRHGSRRAAECP